MKIFYNSLCLVSVVVPLAVSLPVTHFGFVDYDDPAYDFDNPHVLRLTPSDMK